MRWFSIALLIYLTENTMRQFGPCEWMLQSNNYGVPNCLTYFRTRNLFCLCIADLSGKPGEHKQTLLFSCFLYNFVDSAESFSIPTAPGAISSSSGPPTKTARNTPQHVDGAYGIRLSKTLSYFTHFCRGKWTDSMEDGFQSYARLLHRMISTNLQFKERELHD